MPLASRLGGYLAALFLLGTLEPARAQEPDIQVSKEQIVTLSGSSPSLRGVIQQLCAASDVELRQYDAEDRPFAGNYQGVALTEVLERLLRSESYAVGLRSAGGSQNPRIAWVRVMGASTGKPAQPLVPLPRAVADTADDDHEQDDDEVPKPSPELAVDLVVAILAPAYTSVDNEAERRARIDKITKKFAENQDAKEALELADPSAVAGKLAEYRDARAVFMMIQAGIPDPAVQRRLNMIAGALNGALAARGVN